MGSNSTCKVIDWPGLSVAGKVAPPIEKPVPLTAAELTVSAAVPVEEILSDCSCGVLRATLPNPMEVAFTLIAGALAEAGESEMLKLLDTPFNFAVMMAVCGFVTLAMVG